MSKEGSIPWQDLPTVVELTEEGARKQETSRKVAELFEDASDPITASGWSVETLVRDFQFGGEEVPTIVASAAPLLNLAHAVRHTDEQPDIEQLRRVAMEGIRRYERDLSSARISPERARAAHYVISATVDDVILSKPWGVRAGWARSGLVSTFHMDVTGGDRVFDLLDHFHQSPSANKDLLLLIYLCLSLAFEGRTRVSARGPLELGRIRDGLYKTLLGQYGIFERELSPHWRGVSARHKPLRTAVALWTLLSAVVLALALGYLFFVLTLNRTSDGTFTRLAGLGPQETPSIVHTIRPEPVVEEEEEIVEDTPPVVEEQPPVVEETPAPPSRIENLLAFLQPEVDQGHVTLADSEGRLLVRINNSGLFDVASAQVLEDYRGLIERIGTALAAERYEAIVLGYTDNDPINTPQFPSNWQLSEARATAVGEIIVQFTGPGTIRTQGMADSDPIASNTTPEGRALNRRTEILVLTELDNNLEDYGIRSSDAPATQQPESDEDGFSEGEIQ